MAIGALLHLSGIWKLARDPQNVGRAERWFEVPRPEAEDVPVPGIIQQVFPGYHGVAWYWLRFSGKLDVQPGQRCLLRFGAVDYLAEVWLNGQALGGHEGGETPFELDATAALRPGAENLLAVRVLNPTNDSIDGYKLDEIPHRNKVVPPRIGSSFNQGGLLGPVELRVLPAVRIADVFAAPDVARGAFRVQVTLRNDTPEPASARLSATIAPAHAAGDAIESAWEQAVEMVPGESLYTLDLHLRQPHLWDLDDPYLYQLALRLEGKLGAGEEVAHAYSLRCGLRDFRVQRGFFRLNGRRVFLRSTHTGNHFPIGQQIPVDPDHMRRDLINAKATGFNMVRFIAGMPIPEQLDLCDELGLMVYEECYAAWCLADSPQMAERFDQATTEMVLRDRNHPCVTIWGLLNETTDGPVFRQAAGFLPKLRALDDSRLVLLGSGRWDCQWSIGSVSNPGGREWEHVWGVEAPDAEPAPYDWKLGYPGGYFRHAGDAHAYPSVPHTPETDRFIRTLGKGSRPVFLSEYGIGSLFNVIREARGFEQAESRRQARQLGGVDPRPSVPIRPDLEDAAWLREMGNRLAGDWERLSLQGVYPFPEDFLRDSQRLHVRQRLMGFDLIRANPQLCGYNLTGMLDHGMTGEGLWTFWREWKPGIADALADGWAPLRWCLFADPLHGYLGRPLQIEAVLATEDVLPPGEYPVTARIASSHGGIAWEQRTAARIPALKPGEDGPLAVPVLQEEITLQGPAGAYTLAVELERGGSPAGGRLGLHLSDPGDLPRVQATVNAWGVDTRVQRWLAARGVTCHPLTDGSNVAPGVILVGDPGEAGQEAGLWRDVVTRILTGSVAVFLSPAVFRRGDDPVGWLPLSRKGRCYAFGDWLYHKECVAKAHPVFAGLQAPGIMDWDYYGAVVPHDLFDGQDTPTEVMAAAIAVSYPCPGGYASGVLMGAYPLGAGRFVLNTLRILDQVDRHPAADRLLLNLIAYALGHARTAPADLPNDLPAQLANLGYA